METNTGFKFDRLILFVVIYTAVFMAFYLTIPYILPFLLGFIIALIAQPIINVITKNTKIKRPIVGLAVVLIIFAVIFGLLAAIITRIVNELISLSAMLPDMYDVVMKQGYKYLDKAASYFAALDPAISDSIRGSVSKLFSGSFVVAVTIVNYLLTVLKSLPGLLMLILFTLLSAVYIAIDLPMLKDRFYSLFSKESGSKARSIVLESNRMISGYVKAYLILISITFIETYIGTSILNIKYAAIISLVTSISDLLPVLGPGTVLIPMGISFIAFGSYVKGIGILITYAVITAVRQVLEPKVVSSSLGLYPLSIIAAIFIGLKAAGFKGMIFTVFLVIFYSVLKRVKVL